MSDNNLHFTSQDSIQGGNLYFIGNKNNALTDLSFEEASFYTGIKGRVRIQCPSNTDFITVEGNGNIWIRGELIAQNINIYQGLVCFLAASLEEEQIKLVNNEFICSVGKGATENDVKASDGSLYFMSDRVPGFELRVDSDENVWFGGYLLKDDVEIYNYFKSWLELAVGERLLTQKS